MKICAALGCGPNVESNFGFDLISYDDSVMFCMEECVKIHNVTEEHIASLKQSLRLMHSFKIIHFDIKPDNFLFSPYFRRPVFIDFGLSEVIIEELGWKSLVKFRGSPGYCSD
jgi:serine/threonine protein kinase